jgi:membrane-bound lytic murein transglycosylase MltF
MLIKTVNGVMIRMALTVLLGLAMPVCLMSCSPEKETEDRSAGESLKYSLSSHFGESYREDLDGLLERKYIRVLTTFNRTNFFLSGTGLYGFEYALLKDYEKHLNRNVKRGELSVVMEFIPVARDRLVPMLLEGYGDIAAAGLTVTPERLKDVDFTDPYLSGVDEVVVAHKDVRGLKGLEALSGREVFVRKSSSYHESLLNLNEKLSSKSRKPVRIIRADETLETEDILEMVNSGAIGITVADSHIAAVWSSTFRDIRVLGGLKLREGGDIAWMVRRDRPGLKADLDAFVRQRRKGTLYGNIYFNRYFRNNRWIKNPLANSALKVRGSHAGLFRKYADMYGFDRVLLMALAYQESGLDNSKKSSAGAVGIMQIKPSTAADPNVGIKDVHLLENNIHAGVKYLAFLRDRYFSGNGMRDRDRVRFSLAAYNAGPGNVRKIRKLAADLGLDPDRWFRNAEIAALRVVGRETVDYVSNINKYYIVFNLALKRENEREAGRKKLTRH